MAFKDWNEREFKIGIKNVCCCCSKIFKKTDKRLHFPNLLIWLWIRCRCEAHQSPSMCFLVFLLFQRLIYSLWNFWTVIFYTLKENWLRNLSFLQFFFFKFKSPIKSDWKNAVSLKQCVLSFVSTILNECERNVSWAVKNSHWKQTQCSFTLPMKPHHSSVWHFKSNQGINMSTNTNRTQFFYFFLFFRYNFVWIMFKETFKYYKSKCPPPTYEKVIDFDAVDENVSGKSIWMDLVFSRI